MKHFTISDKECLKMDLQDEQMREKSLSQLIEVLSEETTFENISDIEKTELAEKYVKDAIVENVQHSLYNELIFFSTDIESKGMNFSSAPNIIKLFRSTIEV